MDRRLVTLTAAVVLAIVLIVRSAADSDTTTTTLAPAGPSPQAPARATVVLRPNSSPTVLAPDTVTVSALAVDDRHPVVGDPADIAALVAVTVWTWRYDQPFKPTGLDDVATSDLITHLTPTDKETTRRRACGEVSWANATTISVSSDGGAATVTVGLEHHLLTSATVEQVTRRQVTVGLVQHGDGWVATTLDETP